MRGERLDKLLARLGLGSRKEVARLVRAGRVRVAGEAVRDPGFHVPEGVSVEVDGKPLALRRHHHILLHKPAGYVTSRAEGPSVYALLEGFPTRDLSPVGRLDKDTEGLLLFTTDGELLHRLTHPRRKVAKRYRVHLERPATEEDQRAFAEGLFLDGERLLPAELSFGEDPTRVELVLWEGRFHQVKRMFQARGNRVLYLKRLALGPLALGDLPLGKARPLAPEEEAALYQAVGLAGQEA
ncbi:pseudouridine synthase [Thermus thermamylovorans]|uniref:Pseudouridine synthase n=1 Tax=Thermus thermamylovorans TaxID=2509362 RepID=A0A4Q9B660_9DEIN|nr:pseudouridine synthase [Thermus thermamylovorans]TBH21134.1 rRNA pseudouridine synthase [Thermus thermamylovorans]